MPGVCARRGAGHQRRSRAACAPTLPAWDDSRVTDADETVVIAHNWDELRRFMWDYVGIVRTNKRLERAAHRIALLQDGDRTSSTRNFHVTRDLLELRNLVQVADLIVRSAQVATKAAACISVGITRTRGRWLYRRYCGQALMRDRRVKQIPLVIDMGAPELPRGNPVKDAGTPCKL